HLKAVVEVVYILGQIEIIVLIKESCSSISSIYSFNGSIQAEDESISPFMLPHANFHMLQSFKFFSTFSYKTWKCLHTKVVWFGKLYDFGIFTFWPNIARSQIPLLG
ncbi:hypothetical protein ACJX0J_010779, partial [Zea mays]